MSARVVAAVLLLALSAPAQFVSPEGSRYHNGSTLLLEDDGRAGPLLQKLQAAADRLDTEETVALLHALRALQAPSLVPLGPRVHVPALERAARLVLEPGREALAAAVLVDERAAIAEAGRARNLPALLDRATRGVSLPSSREAGLLAGRLLFEEGRFWEAGALAARAGELPGAAALAAAVARRLPPPAAAPADLGAAGWAPQGSATVAARLQGETGLPFIAASGRDAVLYLDSQKLQLFDRTTRAVRGKPCLLLDELQARSDDLMFEPATRRFVAVPAGTRWVLPLNALTDLSPSLDNSTRRAALMAVDVRDEPRVAWTTAPPADDEESSACGPPAIAGGRVFSLVFRSDLQVRVSLACFDLAGGGLLWETPLASAPQAPRYATRFAATSMAGLDKRPADVPPAERDGVLWCSTGDGVLAAVDGLTGAPFFTFRYDRITPQDPASYEPAFLFETGGWDEEPVRFANGRVIVAPPDSRFLYMLATEPGPRGQLVLDDPIEKLDRAHVVSLRPDPQGRPSPAVLCTRRSGGRGGLVLLGPDGHVLAASPLLPPAAALSGRPLAVGDRVLLPTRAGLLELSQSDLSAPPRPVPLTEGLRLGIASACLLDDGLATLAPVLGARNELQWNVLWYTPAR